MEKNKLIIDCGAHDGSDTRYYLSLGHRVVSIDASPKMCKEIEGKNKFDITNGRLKVINYAISKTSGVIEFYESTWTHWNSSNKNIASRLGTLSSSFKVNSKKLSDIVEELNEKPLYIKIDIEGNDYDAIVSLCDIDSGLKPTYISCETECIGEHDVITNEEALKTLDALVLAGYKKFKLVDQSTLCPVTLSNYKNIEKVVYPYSFTAGMTGCFGDSIPTSWIDFDTAKETLVKYREWFDKRKTSNFQFWCDWHATV